MHDELGGEGRRKKPPQRNASFQTKYTYIKPTFYSARQAVLVSCTDFIAKY